MARTSIRRARSPLHPGRSATLIFRDTVLGWMGEIHPDLVRSLDAKEPLVAAELDIAALMRSAPQSFTHFFHGSDHPFPGQLADDVRIHRLTPTPA